MKQDTHPLNIDRMAEAAIAVLGSVLVDEACAAKVLTELDDDDFVWDKYRAVFQYIRKLFREGKHIDTVMVSEGLRLSGIDVGDFCNQLWTMTPTADLVDGYIEILKETAAVYRLADIGIQLQRMPPLEEGRALLEKAYSICVRRPSVQAVTFQESFEKFCDAHSTQEETPFFPWPIAKITDANKLRRGHLAVLGASSGVGKTAFALQAVDGFSRMGPVGYYTFESSAKELYARHVARTALVDARRIQDNKLTAEDWDEIAAPEVIKVLGNPLIFTIPASGMTAEDVINHAMSARYAAIVVDYVQHVRVNTKGRKYAMSEYERVTECSMAFQSFAARTGTAVLLLSQLSRPQKVTRSVRTAGGTQAVSITPPPTLSSLRSSGQLEQDADVVLLMWREDDEDPASPRRLQIAKNRHGPSGGYVRLAFDGAHQAFSLLSSREEYGGQYGTRKPAAPAARDAAQMSIENADDYDLPF